MELRQIPLKIVLDEIAAPPGTTQIPFSGGTVYLPGGNTVQIASGSVTMTLDASSFVVSAKQCREMIDRLDALTWAGREARDAFGNAIRNGVLGPAVPDDQG